MDGPKKRLDRRFCGGADSTALRSFLLKAPGHFGQLGQDLSAVSHVTSFWAYWWTDREKGSLSAADAMEMFPSFLRSLLHKRAEKPLDGDAQRFANG